MRLTGDDVIVFTFLIPLQLKRQSRNKIGHRVFFLPISFLHTPKDTRTLYSVSVCIISINFNGIFYLQFKKL